MQATSPHYASAPANIKRRKPDYATLLVSLGALAILLPLCLFSLAIITFQVFELNLPGAHVFDQHVGLINREDTVALIDKAWNQEPRIHLSSPDDPAINYWVSPQELGIWVDPEATAKDAYRIGRGPDPFTDVIAAASGYPQVIMPTLYQDEDATWRILQEIAEELDISPENARLAYQDDSWVVLPGKDGRKVAIEAILQDLVNNTYIILRSQSLSIQIQQILPSVSDLSPVLTEIETVVASDLVLNAYDPITDEHLSWSVPAEIKRAWVTVDEATHEVYLSYHQDALSELINQWEQDLGQGRTLDIPDELEPWIEHWENELPIQTTLRHAPTVYQVSPGESLWSISLKLGMPMWYIMNANEGLTAYNLEAGMVLTIPSRNDLLPLPVVPNKRIVIDISTQRMTVYEEGQVRSTHVISTGVKDSPTMAGIFQVQTHNLNAYASNWDLYMPHFLGIYEAWPGFMNGIHGLPMLSHGQRLWAGNLGQPVSYGCIIMNLAEAEDLYYWAEPGVVVEITQ